MENNIKTVLQRLSSLEERLENLERYADATTMSTGGSNPKEVTLQKFIKPKKPANDVEKTLTIAYYLEKFLNFTSFNIGDLEKAYERAKETKPKNMNDKVNMNIRNAHLEEASEKKDGLKAWYLTSSGESYVENNFKTVA